MKWLPIHSELYGLNVHRAVLAAGQATTGVSVHLVTEEYDAGPVIAPRAPLLRTGRRVSLRSSW